MTTDQDLAYEANDAFYRWEKIVHGDDSPLSDEDRLMWVSGYIVGFKNGSDDEVI